MHNVLSASTKSLSEEEDVVDRVANYN